jgi:hypothetical protein
MSAVVRDGSGGVVGDPGGVIDLGVRGLADFWPIAGDGDRECVLRPESELSDSSSSFSSFAFLAGLAGHSSLYVAHAASLIPFAAHPAFSINFA